MVLLNCLSLPVSVITNSDLALLCLKNHILKVVTLQEYKLWPVSNEFTIRALVVGPSSLSATQPCRLNERSLQLTRTLFPNFSSNCRTSGSMPEKSSFCGIIYKKKRFHQANDIYTISAEVNEAIISTQK